MAHPHPVPIPDSELVGEPKDEQTVRYSDPENPPTNIRGGTEVSEDWPDPWPLTGMTNREWAVMLLTYIFGSDVIPISDPEVVKKVEYLTRALDIACMYSQPPGQKIRLRLCDLLDEALDKIEVLDGVQSGGWVSQSRNEVEMARRFKGR